VLASDLADCTRAYELTRKENTAKLPLCVSKEGIAALKKRKKAAKKDTKDRCGRCSEIESTNEKMRQDRAAEKERDWEHYESSSPGQNARPRHEIPEPEEVPREEAVVQDKSKKPLSWVGHIFQKFTNFSAFSVSLDTWRACLWDLFTHAAFFTYVHHDAAGFCTYAFVRCGCKIWGIHRPHITEKENTRMGVFDIMRRILRPHGHTSYIPYSDLYNVFLMPGDVL
jgi:hypothetical protein